MKQVDGRAILEPGDAIRIYPRGLGSGPGYEPGYAMVIDTNRNAIVFGQAGLDSFLVQRTQLPAPGFQFNTFNVLSTAAGIPAEIAYAMQVVRAMLELPVQTVAQTFPDQPLDRLDCELLAREGIEVRQDRERTTVLRWGPGVSPEDSAVALLLSCKGRRLVGYGVGNEGGTLKAELRFGPA